MLKRTQKRNAKIIELYNQGVPVKEIAERCGVVYPTVAKLLKASCEDVKRRYRPSPCIDPSKDVVEQLREKGRLKEIPETGCLEPDVYVRPNGYPEMMINGKKISLHRFVLQQQGFQLIGRQIIACHKCNNRKCINPRHLYAGTPQQNSNDMVVSGRSYKGEKQINSKLKESQVREIRQLHASGLSYSQIAEKYSVHFSLVGYIVRREIWKHVD
jgi:transposase